MAAPAEMLDLIALDRELAGRSFRQYVEMAFPQVEPGVRFLANWHIDAICEHMQAVFNNEIKNLVINVPPGSMKSLSICTLYPTWAWGPADNPARRMIFGSYGEPLAYRDSLRSRQLIESQWYQARWGEAAETPWNRVIANKQQWAKRLFSNTAGGSRQAVTVRGGVTGFHAHDIVVDDPIKPQECTEVALTEAEEWWFRTIPSRRLAGAHMVVIMQRLHERDIAGICLEKGWDCLVIPMEYERAVRTCTPLKWEDPRTQEGEPLWPERWPGTDLPELKETMGPREVASQLQQRPAPAEGAIFKKSYIRYYNAAPPLRKMRVMLSVDANFKATDNGSYAVIQAWGMLGSNFYALDQRRGRWAFSELLEEVRQMAAKWSTASTILVEDKANGPAIISMLSKELSGVIPCEPHGDKVQRANAVEPLWAAHNVWLPDERIAPWVKDFVHELLTFPVARHDDQVDTMTQALSYLKGKNMDKFVKAMQNVAASAPRSVIRRGVLR